MLTPSANDPNRKSELKRRKDSPGDFGPTPLKVPPDWNPNSSGGLVVPSHIRTQQKQAAAEAEAAAELKDMSTTDLESAAELENPDA